MAEFCMVKRAMHAFQVDGPDEDADPDLVMVQGKITFTPLLGKGDVITMVEDGQPVSVVPRPITARVSNGLIMHRGREGVRLLAGGTQMRPEQIRYRASFSEMQAGGWAFTVRNVDFVAKPGGEVDLTLVGPVANMPDGNNRGPMGAGITDVHVDGSELVVIVTDEDGSRELSRLPLDDIVRSEADAAAKVAADAVRDDLAATLGDAGESAAAADASAKAAATSARESADSATAAAGSASDAVTAQKAASDAAEKTAADRVQTGADRVATGEYRTAAAQSATTAEGAASTATSEADRATTEADRAQAAADSVDTDVIRREVTDQIAAVVDGAPEDLDTIREVAEYAQENRDITDTLNAAIGQKADKAHTHSVADVTGLQAALDGKAASSHTHTMAQVTGLDAALGAKLDASKIQVVTTIPASPVAGTIYLVTGA